MAATKKVKGKKVEAATRKRLTPEQREAIANEPADLTLAKIAEKYDTSINTVSKYRKGATSAAASTTGTVTPKRGRPAGTSTTASKGDKSSCPPAIFGILADSGLKDSQKVKMIAAYYEV